MENEVRLIDAKQAIAEINRVETNHPYDDKEDIIEKCVNILNTATTVDAVEVVRCKGCKHSVWDEENEMWKCVESAYYDEDSGEWFGFCEYHTGDFFCADGERKDNDI